MLAALRGQPAELPDSTLGGVAGRAVSGAFVSLKRGRHLRSCCGFLGRPVALAAALQEAAEKTVWEDMRFPPVSLRELPQLDFEVWLLHNQQPVRAQGEERLNSVVVGTHGLNVVRGDAHGLLLPCVPVEHNWDSRRFLEQVCVKAGLHPTAWKDSATALSTFEGESVQGRVSKADAANAGPYLTLPFQPKDLHDFTGHCLRNIAALLVGATPDYYLPGKTDGYISGVSLALRGLPNLDDLNLSQISLRPGVPLQATLFKLAQAAAHALAQRRLVAEDLQRLDARLAFFFDPVMHGTVADADLSDTDWERRGILVIERSRWGLVFDPGRSVEERLADAAQQAKVRRPEFSSRFQPRDSGNGTES